MLPSIINLSVSRAAMCRSFRGVWSDSCRNLALELSRKLRAIWISHPHADHHLGLLRILVERKRAFAGVSPERSQAKRARMDTESAVAAADRPQVEEKDYYLSARMSV